MAVSVKSISSTTDVISIIDVVRNLVVVIGNLIGNSLKENIIVQAGSESETDILQNVREMMETSLSVAECFINFSLFKLGNLKESLKWSTCIMQDQFDHQMNALIKSICIEVRTVSTPSVATLVMEFLSGVNLNIRAVLENKAVSQKKKKFELILEENGIISVMVINACVLDSSWNTATSSVEKIVSVEYEFYVFEVNDINYFRKSQSVSEIHSLLNSLKTQHAKKQLFFLQSAARLRKLL